MTKTALEILELAVRAADDRLAQDIVALDVRNVTPIADYFVVTHARNDKQLDAIVGSVVEAATRKALKSRTSKVKTVVSGF